MSGKSNNPYAATMTVRRIPVYPSSYRKLFGRALRTDLDYHCASRALGLLLAGESSPT